MRSQPLSAMSSSSGLRRGPTASSRRTSVPGETEVGVLRVAVHQYCGVSGGHYAPKIASQDNPRGDSRRLRGAASLQRRRDIKGKNEMTPSVRVPEYVGLTGHFQPDSGRCRLIVPRDAFLGHASVLQKTCVKYGGFLKYLTRT